MRAAIQPLQWLLPNARRADNQMTDPESHTRMASPQTGAHGPIRTLVMSLELGSHATYKNTRSSYAVASSTFALWQAGQVRIRSAPITVSAPADSLYFKGGGMGWGRRSCYPPPPRFLSPAACTCTWYGGCV